MKLWVEKIQISRISRLMLKYFFLLAKKSFQPLRTYMLRNALRVHALARGLQSAFIDIGGEDLHLGCVGQRGGMLAQQDRDRVGFFSGCAADNADPNLAVRFLALKQLRNHLRAKGLKRFGVAKELGHADQQILEKLVGFFRLTLQDLDVLFDGLNLQGFHAALQAPCDRAFLVLAEIVPSAPLEQGVNPSQAAGLSARGCHSAGRGAHSGERHTP